MCACVHRTRWNAHGHARIFLQNIISVNVGKIYSGYIYVEEHIQSHIFHKVNYFARLPLNSLQPSLGMHFLGLLPMIDPPRYDTAVTVRRLMEAGVEVKMITGDHLNIAIETARMVRKGRFVRGLEKVFALFVCLFVFV